MTMGELYDKLKAIATAEKDVQEAMNRLEHGGSPETIKRKEEQVWIETSWLETLRDEEIKL